MSLIQDLKEATVAIEIGKALTYQELYNLLLRSLLEVRRLEHQIRILEDRHAE